ncbi:MAG: glycosyltransferase [bacterium]|nr:glycosyltransferase [bacterium]
MDELTNDTAEVDGSARPRARAILIINGTDFGGTESALAEIALGLRRRRYGVTVLSLKPLGKLGVSLAQQRVAVHTLGMGELVGSLALLSGIWRLRRWLKGTEGDVVHSFLPRSNIMSRVANRFSGKRRPHFSSERSTDFKRSRLVSFLNRVTVQWTERVLVVAPVVEEILKHRDRLPESKLAPLHNGIDLAAVDRFPTGEIRRTLGLTDEDQLFCSVGRLIEDKGYHYLLRAMAQMRWRGPSVHLALIGDGPEETRLRAEVETLGLDRQVHFLGYRRDVYGALKEADAFVLSSLEEGVPVVVLEAMACGLPVVATQVGGVTNLVVESQTGFLVPPEETWEPSRAAAARSNGVGRGIAALAAAMDRLVEDSELRREFGRQGRHRVEEHFHIDRVLTQLEEYYAGVLEPEIGADAR